MGGTYRFSLDVDWPGSLLEPIGRGEVSGSGEPEAEDSPTTQADRGRS
jgi:hypothetical protein